MKRAFIDCPQCGQKGNARPGLHFVSGGAEAVHFADGEVLALQMIECRKCGYRWAVAAGSVTAVKE